MQGLSGYSIACGSIVGHDSRHTVWTAVSIDADIYVMLFGVLSSVGKFELPG